MTNNLIAQRIMELAEAKNIKRSMLPDLSGVSKDRLDNLFKRPGARPNREDTMRLASLLETTEAYLLDGGPKPSSSEALRAEAQQRLQELSDEELRILLIGLRRPRVARSLSEGS